MKYFAWLGLLGLTVACGSRASSWDTRFAPEPSGSGILPAYGLSGSVAVMDKTLGRVLMLHTPSELTLAVDSIVLGQNLAAAQVSADQETLYALSRGVQPQRNPGDEAPQLMAISGGTSPGIRQSYVLGEPMDQLTVDPQGEWVVLSGGSGVVVNPNELMFVHVSEPGAAPVSKTLRSFGGKPARFTFTSPLSPPGATARRFLVVERETDVVLIDLSDLSRSEITVPLGKTENNLDANPEQVAFHDGDASNPAPLIAVRIAQSSSVLLLQLGQTVDGSSAFSIVTNLVDVGAHPATVDFVSTGQAVRLAALVGNNAVLVDPTTTNLTTVPMGAAFTGLRRITDAVGSSAGDVALLYSPNTTQIAYWTLGAAASYRSIDSYSLEISVADVLDIPGTLYAGRKILKSPSLDFYVLDLNTRQSAPMDTISGLELDVSPDGSRVWAFQPGGLGFASVGFDTLSPKSFSAERALSGVFEIAAADGGRSALALHIGSAGLAATVLDARAPSTATARFFSSLELGGVR